MKLTTVLLIATLLQVSATGLAQKITFVQKDVTIKQVFDQVYKQTGYSILWPAQTLRVDKKINANFHNTSLADVMKQCLDNLELDYAIEDKSVVISKKQPTILEKIVAAVTSITVHGKIVDENGNPLPGVTITVKGTANVTASDNKGEFTLTGVDEKAELLITSVGYKPITLKVAAEMGSIKLEVVVSSLDQVQVIGYGTTSKRLNTGNVSTLSAKEIDEQPVTNVLSALSGRMPGVFVQTTNGLPGGNITIQIRGQNSIRNSLGNNGNLPLYIIDGVPFSAESPTVLGTNTNLTATMSTAVSPFNSLNPDDIESISILKDADATAIYGSRGANGVVLITTKKGKPGTSKVDINFSQGVSGVANYPQLLTLDQYLQIRREAYQNDGRVPSADPNSTNYAPDLMVFSQTEGTNWAKYMMGHTASSSDLQSSLSGGTQQTQFLVSANFHNESTVLLGDGNYRRIGMHANINHRSLNEKFSVQFSTSYTGDNNSMPNPSANLRNEILAPPNMPLYDNAGNLSWAINPNPLADILAHSTTNTNNFLANTIVGYRILSGLQFKTSLGYNAIGFDEVATYPVASQYPGIGVSKATYGNTFGQSLIVEPMFTYDQNYKASHMTILLGGTYQNSVKKGNTISGSNYSNDALIQSAASATTLTARNDYLNYKYESVFARITYSLNSKYIFNASARRDGSSRFGPSHQFGNFGSVGAAWLFGDENRVRELLPFLSYGKLRGSFGITGNDQIANYQFLTTYGGAGANVYQGVAGLKSLQVANPDLHWESNQKAEVAVELGFFKDRILLNAAYYRNNSGDQLVTYTLPTITGFTGYTANLPAVIRNTGWELELNTVNISSKNFKWKTNFNITLPKNRLIDFPGLANSTYANTLVIGQDINQGIGYLFTGVDPATGKAMYAPQPGSTSTTPYSFFKFGQTSPYFYGGFGNNFTYGNLQLDLFGQFVKQFASGTIRYSPGVTTSNDFAFVANRWQKPGDITNVPKASKTNDSSYPNSTANWFDASYFRLKNIAVSYGFPGPWLQKRGINNLRIYLQGQNLWTLRRNNTALYDPETGFGGGGPLTGTDKPIPPLRSFVAGIQVTL